MEAIAHKERSCQRSASGRRNVVNRGTKLVGGRRRGAEINKLSTK